MRRWLPAPWLSVAVFCGWLLLSRSASPGQMLLGLLVALIVPWMALPLRPRPGPLRRWGVLVLLVLRVGVEVSRSAVEVAVGIARAHRRPPNGAFVVVPLDLHDVHGLAALAMISAVIPGTVWSELASDRSALLMHVFDLDDEAAFIDRFKRDYERPLKEIFE